PSTGTTWRASARTSTRSPASAIRPAIRSAPATSRPICPTCAPCSTAFTPSGRRPMNFAKGRKTRGRGAGFKGKLRDDLRDKGAATADRVGFVHMRNLATADPRQAWREMKTLCDAADDLKRRAGVPLTGQKLRQPVYAFTLNWHPLDQPDAGHMRETAEHAIE